MFLMLKDKIISKLIYTIYITAHIHHVPSYTHELASYNLKQLTVSMQGSTMLGVVLTPVRYLEMNFFVTSIPRWLILASLVSGSTSTPRNPG